MVLRQKEVQNAAFPNSKSRNRLQCFSLISRNPVKRKPFSPTQLSHRILSFYFKTVTVMRNQWCNTRQERPSCTSKPWQDNWEPKGRTQQVSSWPGWAPLAGPLTLPGGALCPTPRPSRPGACVCPTPLPSLWHSSDTNGWGVSRPRSTQAILQPIPEAETGRCSWPLEMSGTCFCFCC